MIEPDVRIEGFDARSWDGLWSLFRPPADARALGTLWCVVDEEGHVLAALTSTRGRLEGIERADDLEALCRAHGVRRGIRLTRGTLEELAERLATTYSDDDGYAEQLLEAARVVRHLERLGHVARWPRPRWVRPIPSPAMLEAALALVLPPEQSLVVALYDAGVPLTAAAVGRGRRGIDRIVGPAHLGLRPVSSSGDRAAEAARVRALVSSELGPVHLGLFGEARVVRGFLRAPAPGAWLRAAADGGVLFDPAPPFLAVALAADGARAVAHASLELVGSSAFGAVAGALGRYLRDRVETLPSPERLLGWSPLEVLADLLERDLPLDVREPREP